MNDSRPCLECINTIFYRPFQAMIGCQVFFAIASILSVTHFLLVFIRPSPLHRNFKTLLTIYFLNSILHSCIFLASVGSLFYRVFFYENALDAFMDRNTYIILHLLICFTLNVQILSEFLICVERVIATIRVSKYENENSKLTLWMFFAIIFFLPVAFIQWAYYDENFEQPQLFPLVAPISAQQKINILFVIGMLFVVSALIITFYTRYINKRKKTIYQFRLTTRYQIAENIVTSHIMSTVLFSNLFVTIFFTVSIMILRNLRDNDFVNQNLGFYSTIKLLVYPHHVAAVIIPMFSGCYLQKLRQTRIESLTNMVTIQSNGKIASETYRTYLTRQWT
ncbi:unnamed protein product [Caenorhabditis angaria]|uniref:Uncharacterized protein n=1 Tax=Caenorhabditis angaria TaxID=860376 RepID=A0A9P1I6Q3_9PELO|nr:unnamed protein product [Caenorhabditis angaria]